MNPSDQENELALQRALVLLDRYETPADLERFWRAVGRLPFGCPLIERIA